MEIKIVMTTGNDAFQTENDVADALRRLAYRIDTKGLENITKVMDTNGNCVGSVETTK